MAINPIGSAIIAGSGNATPDINTSAAKLLIGVVSNFKGEASSSTFVDTVNIGGTDRHNSWTLLAEYQASAVSKVAIYGCVNPIYVGPGHSAKFTQGGTPFSVTAFAAYSASSDVAFDDETGSHTDSSGTTIQPGSFTPANPVSLIIVAACFAANGDFTSINQSFTRRQHSAYASGTALGSGFADLYQAAPSAINPTVTSVSSFTDAAIALACFYETDPAEPLSASFTKAHSRIAVGNSLACLGMASNVTGTPSYEWKVDGTIRATTQNYTIPSLYLDEDDHTIDFSVTDDTGTAHAPQQTVTVTNGIGGVFAVNYDSRGKGYGLDDQPHQNWPYLLGIALGVNYAIINPSVENQDLVTDFTSKAPTAIYPYFDESKPENYYFTGGSINDFRHGHSASVVWDTLQAEMTRARGVLSTIVIMVPTIFGEDDGVLDSGQLAEMLAYNAMVLADAGATIDIVYDWAAKFPDPDDETKFLPDHVHLNAEGNIETKDDILNILEPPADMNLLSATVINSGQIDVAFDEDENFNTIKIQRDTVNTFDSGNLVTYDNQTPDSPWSNNAGLNPTVTTTYYYQSKAKTINGKYSLDWSNIRSAKITVLPVAAFTLASDVILYGDNLVVASNDSTGGRGSGVNTYQWYIADVLVATSATPTLSGIPIGTHTLRLVVDDGEGHTDEHLHNFSVVEFLPLNITSSRLADGALSAYSQQIVIEGGVAPYTLEVLKGTVPTGCAVDLSGDTVGLVHGTPTAGGLYAFEAKAIDAAGNKVRKVITIFIDDTTTGVRVLQSLAIYRAGSNAVSPISGVRFVRGDTLKPEFLIDNGTGALSFTDNGAGGTFEIVDNLAIYTPANRTQSVTITGTAENGSQNKTFFVFATFPLYPNVQYDIEYDEETKTQRARGGTRYFKEIFVPSITWKLSFNKRMMQETNEIFDFLVYHRKIKEFWIWDIERKIGNKVRRTSSLPQRFENANSWTSSTIVEGDYNPQILTDDD